MAGIFGIIGDLSRDDVFEKTLLHLNNYKSHSLTINRNVFMGVTAFNFMEDTLLEKDDFIIALNGEYYCDDTDSTSSPFIIYDMFKKYGKKFITRIDGIFNIFIYDKKHEKLLIFNDWSGSHNLFYYHDGNRFIFSTETKGILKIIPKKTIDKTAVVEQFVYGHLFFEKTLVEEIALLPPASILEFQDGKFFIDNYYDPKDHYKKIDEKKKPVYYIDELYELFKKPTFKYLHRQKIALLLTGGMDSRLLLHLMLEYEYPLKEVFTFKKHGMPLSALEDVTIAKAIAEKIGLKHILSDLPFEYYKSKFYDSYYIHEGFLPQSPYIYSCNHIDILKRGYQYIIQYPSGDLTFGSRINPRTKKIFGDTKLTDTSKKAIFNRFLATPKDVIDNLFRPEYQLYGKIENSVVNYLDQFRDFSSLFAFDYFAWYQHSRRGGNIGGMQGQFTGRIAPSQDRKLVQFGFNLPVKFKNWQYLYKLMFKAKCPVLAKFPRESVGVPISWPENAQLLYRVGRKCFERIFPRVDNTQNGPGFFFRNIVRKEIESILVSKRLEERVIFNMPLVRQLWDEHIAGKDNCFLIHNIVNTELFYRNYID
jgi:hypothetical protein